MFKLLKKLRFLLFLASLLFLALLIFECAGYGYEKLVVKNNPLIASYLAGDSISVEQEKAHFDEEPLSSLLEQTGKADTIKLPKLNPDTEELLDYFLTGALLDEETRADQRLAFRSWSGQAREYYARLTRETVIVFNAENVVRHCYGEEAPYFEGFQRSVTMALLHQAGILNHVYAALEKARESNQPVSFSFLWFEHNPTSPIFSAWCIPGLRSGPAWAHDYIFVALHPEEVQRTEQALAPEEQRWETKHFRYKANYTEEDPLEFSTNSLGFRDRERTFPKEPECFRILCIGDDVVVEGSTNDHTFPALLEKELVKTFPDNHIEVLNAGLSEITSAGHLLHFFDYMALEPDLILMQPGSSDMLKFYNRLKVNLLPTLSRGVRWFLPDLTAPSSPSFSTALEHALGTNLDLFLRLLKEKEVPCILMAQPYLDYNLLSRQEVNYFNWRGKEDLDFPAFSLKTYGHLLQLSNTLLEEKAQIFGFWYLPIEQALPGNNTAFQSFTRLRSSGIEGKTQLSARFLQPLLETLLK